MLTYAYVFTCACDILLGIMKKEYKKFIKKTAQT